jgi:hypothetical protein
MLLRHGPAPGRQQRAMRDFRRSYVKKDEAGTGRKYDFALQAQLGVE